MIILVCAFLAVLTVPLSGTSLRGMGTLPIRYMALAWVAIGLQTLLVSTPWQPSTDVAHAVHLLSYAVAGLFAVANWRVPGVLLIAFGGALNLIAIVANDGVMPASASALRRAGIGVATEYSNSTFVDDAKFQWLGDIFAIPAHWPLANVFSIGDIVVVIGIGYLAHRHCRATSAPEHLSATDSADALVS